MEHGTRRSGGRIQMGRAAILSDLKDRVQKQRSRNERHRTDIQVGELCHERAWVY